MPERRSVRYPPLPERVAAAETRLDGHDKALETKVEQAAFDPVRLIAFSLAALVLVSFFGALAAMVFKHQ